MLIYDAIASASLYISCAEFSLAAISNKMEYSHSFTLICRNVLINRKSRVRFSLSLSRGELISTVQNFKNHLVGNLRNIDSLAIWVKSSFFFEISGITTMKKDHEWIVHYLSRYMQFPLVIASPGERAQTMCSSDSQLCKVAGLDCTQLRFRTCCNDRIICILVSPFPKGHDFPIL